MGSRAMNTIPTPLLVLGVLAAGWHPAPAGPRAARPAPHGDRGGHALAAGDEKKGGDADQKRKPKFTVGKETTYVTGPLDDDGYIDYAAALNERLGKGVTPKNNANVLLWQALGPRPEGGKGMPPAFFKWMGIEELPEKAEYLIDLFKYVREHRKVEPFEIADELNDQLSRAAERPWAAKEYPYIAGWLKANEKPLALAVEATRRPHYFNPLVPQSEGLIGALLPGVQSCREIARALATRAMLRVGEGKFDDAWQDLLACHRLGRLVGRGATLIDGLVGIAIDHVASTADVAFLARAKLDAKQTLACLNDLQKLPPMPAMADKVDLGERFVFLDCVMLIRRHGIQYLDALAKGGTPKAAPRPLDGIDWEPALRNGNRWYDRMAVAMRLKDRSAREKELNQINNELGKLKLNSRDATSWRGRLRLLFIDKEKLPTVLGEKIGNVLIGMMAPATGKVQAAGDRAEQVQRNLRVAFALAAYHRDHGRYPKELAALAPKYLKEVPDDLFSGKPLAYETSEDGYLLYSVGANGQNEEGRRDDDPPGDDLRVRMPPPKPRRE
jgi:hypothetical protein